MKTKLNKALKQKNRLVGELNRIKSLIQRENSRKEADYNEEKIQDLFLQFSVLTNELIDLKTAIQRATAPIADKLLRLAEIKGQVDFYQSLETTNGTFERSLSYGSDKVKTETYCAYYDQNAVDNKLAEIQKEINDLQDEIDDYNAITTI